MTKDLRLLFFDLLEFLAEDGIGNNVNIREFCNNYEYPEQVGVKYEYPIDWISKRLARVFNALEEIRKTGFIKYSDNPHDVMLLVAKDGIFEASITKDGLDYYYTHALRKATLRSYNNQFYYNLITWTIAIVAVLTTIYTIHQKSDQEQKLQHLTKEVQQLKSQSHSQVAIHKTGDTISKKK